MLICLYFVGGCFHATKADTNSHEQTVFPAKQIIFYLAFFFAEKGC